MIRLFIFLLFFSHFWGSDFLYSYQPYHATVTVESISETVSAPNLIDLERDLKTTSLEKLIPVYTPTSATLLHIDLRGITVLSSFAANSTKLVVNIPQAGITKSFSGATRDQSIILFKDFIKNGADKHKLLKAYAMYSPIDPIAGNPNSLMAQMAQSDYLMGKLSPFTGCGCNWKSQPVVHQFQFGASYGRAFSGNYDTSTLTVPLRYSYSPQYTWALIMDIPLTFNKNGGAYSIFSSLGFGLQIPITYQWSLTPILRFGAGGSLDLATSGDFLASGVTSSLNVKVKCCVLSMINYLGYTFSGNLWLTGINFNYNLHNYVFKNGLSLTTCKGLVLKGRNLFFELYFIDSYFARESLYMRHYDEIGFSLVTNRFNRRLNYDTLSISLSYQFGQKHYKGYFLSAKYLF